MYGLPRLVYHVTHKGFQQLLYLRFVFCDKVIVDLAQLFITAVLHLAIEKAVLLLVIDLQQKTLLFRVKIYIFLQFYHIP